MSAHKPQRLTKPFFTPGTFILLAFMGTGFAFGLARFINGLQTVTNLTNFYPWGIWIAIDVACGVALAAGGFTTAALVDIFGGKKFHPLLRPAVLTAWLGYAMVAVGLSFDLGRYWNIWRPIFNWQGNSVLFEVGMCVMAYLSVLTVEMSPSILEGLKTRIKHNDWGARLLRKIEGPINFAHRAVKIVLPIFIIAGVVLSCMHQSSLGTLMVIAPTKLHALWYTPLLPVLFLLSAIMVGFPMVIVESLIASKSFGQEPEMELLTPLARLIPWFLLVYGVFRFGDLIARRGIVHFLDAQYPYLTIAIIVELTVGIILPFYLLLQEQIRRSPGWLMFSALLVIIGVVLNRINVFITGYIPPYATKMYFPSIGEIAVTIGLVCTIMFLYRIMVTFFPIFTFSGTETRDEPPVFSREPLPPVWSWFFRGVAVAFLLAFVLLYTMVHHEAIAAGTQPASWVSNVQAVKQAPEKLASESRDSRPEGYKTLYVLNSDTLNTRTNFYEPVKFSHRAHDIFAKGDCSICHHRFSFEDGDRVGEEVQAFHLSYFDARISGAACSSCHDMNQISVQKCSHCHLNPNEADYPSRLGLKGAYHQQCIHCHQDPSRASDAPVSCNGCHHPLTPDHTSLVQLTPQASSREITAHCLDCHQLSGEDILKTSHWTWKGHVPHVTGSKAQATTIVKTVLNTCNFATGATYQQCSTCHIGTHWESTGYDFSDASRIDCLVCHDTTGTYEKGVGGTPTENVNLVDISRRVGRPSRANCGNCHFYTGGGPNYLQGDLEPALAANGNKVDVHMGNYNLRCQECHTTREHQIAGISMTSSGNAGRVRCENCHGTTPHEIAGLLGRHLDDHRKAVACETCHIPEYAIDSPTRMSIDFSKAGKDQPVTFDDNGMPRYDKKLGELGWGKKVIPTYLWFNGSRETYTLGTEIDPGKPVALNMPMGNRRDPSAKIYPFKVMTLVQPYDTEQNILAIPKFWHGYWDNYDLKQALIEGMKNAGLSFSGEYGFVETHLYSAVHHGVAPAKSALGCADCHQEKAVDCQRCHTRTVGIELHALSRKVYPAVQHRMDFKALGYEDDPALIGGRFYILGGTAKPPR